MENQLEFNHSDPTSVAQANGLIRCQLLAINVSRVLAVQVDDVTGSVAPSFDPRVVSRDLRIVKLKFRIARAADMKVGRGDLKEANGLAVANQLDFTCGPSIEPDVLLGETRRYCSVPAAGPLNSLISQPSLRPAK
jgi:hypothetical protein